MLSAQPTEEISRARSAVATSPRAARARWAIWTASWDPDAPGQLVHHRPRQPADPVGRPELLVQVERLVHRAEGVVPAAHAAQRQREPSSSSARVRLVLPGATRAQGPLPAGRPRRRRPPHRTPVGRPPRGSARAGPGRRGNGEGQVMGQVARVRLDVVREAALDRVGGRAGACVPASSSRRRPAASGGSARG